MVFLQYVLNNKSKKSHHKEFQKLKDTLVEVNKVYMNLGCLLVELEGECSFNSANNEISYGSSICLVILLIIGIVKFNLILFCFYYFLGVRCIIPNNYFIWEATRPISNCDFCSNVSHPTVLSNISQDSFLPYAYSSKPIVIKQAFSHWPAKQLFSLQYFQNLYNVTEGSFKSVDEECQFLHFKSDFISVKDVLFMNNRRAANDPTEKSWYVGWGNCHPDVLEEMRKHYPKPHFLPDDCEIPSKEYIFMGYDDGATMHLDFINRLIWQAQLKGSKNWNLHPPPECETICEPLSFLVEPGDAVLVDTRMWYHGTTINPGDFSLSVQSEYG
ncbi:unnamed protein product [Phaedon cochleariae]|uniref:Uncharacterized protein n=1 Tax=Phaedon cochleariae TaxID=80249 RepID=A0A9N9SGL9_PHACE|nr:unnamed protein product [Phaedon cochleariae]